MCLSATATSGQLKVTCKQPPAPCRAPQCNAYSRRQTISSFLAAPLLLGSAGVAAADPVAGGFGDTCPTCLGPVDGTLGSCAGIDSCASSYDDRPPHFAAPWMFDGSQQAAKQQLVGVLQDLGAVVQVQRSDYLYATLSPGQQEAPLDLEFLFADNDNTVAVRAAPQSQSPSTDVSSSNTSNFAIQAVFANFAELGKLTSLLTGSQPSQVLDNIRIELGWEEVPILRARRRTFFFGESPFDSFGPVPPPVPDYSRDLADL